MSNTKAAAMPMPAPTPAPKGLIGVCEVVEEAEGETAGNVGGKLGVEDIRELEVVVAAFVVAGEFEVVTATLDEEFGRIVEEVIAASEKTRDEVSQQFARERL